MEPRNPLKTKLIAPDQSELLVFAVPTHNGVHNRGVSLETSNGTRYGYLWYSENSNDLHIERMGNDSDYKRVGSALLECIFREAIRLGKGGHITVQSAWNAHLFYYQNGFRPQHDRVCVLPMSAGNLIGLCNQYLAIDTTDANKQQLEQLEQSIKTHPGKYGQNFYEIGVSNACEKLGKQKEDLTFKEVILHGFYYSESERMQAELAEHKKNGTRIIQTGSYTSTYDMHLPDEIIAAKIKEFGLEKDVVRLVAEKPAETRRPSFIDSMTATRMASDAKENKPEVPPADTGISKEPPKPTV
jgi:hypothetical protein